MTKKHGLALFLIVIGILLLGAAASAEMMIPSSAEYYKGHAYKLYDTACKWTEAQSACEKLGGHLITITSKDEYEFAKKLCGDRINKYCWLGGRKVSGKWTWITGETWSYTAWSPTQPNGSGGGGYVLMQHFTGNTNPWSWDDQNNTGISPNPTYSGAPYYQTTSHYFYICEWENNDLSSATVTLKESEYTYDGSTKKPTVTVKLFGKKLKADTDYTVAYKNNTNIGTATVTVKAKGNYKGSVKQQFSIIPGTPTLKAASKEDGIAQLTLSAAINGATGYEYTYKDPATNKQVTVQSAKTSLTLSKLESGKKYTFRARAYAKTSSGSICYGDYSKTASVTIHAAKDISKGAMTIGKKGNLYVYTGSTIKPTVKVKLGLKTLKEGTDYELTWKKNVNAGTATVTATGINSYTGKLKGTFVIGRAPLKSDYFLLEKDTYTYNGAAIKPKVGAAFNGKALVKGTDFTVSYSKNTDAGTATVKLTGKGNFSETVKKTFTIKPLSITKCNVSLPDGDSYAYTGEALQPKVEVKKGDTVLPSRSYSVSYANNTETGTATVAIRGAGNLKGKVTVAFEITERIVSPVPNGCYFTKQSKDEAKNWVGYHDINVNVSTKTPVYAIANGTVVCIQKYRMINGEKYLTSYGNCINFTSDEIDGKAYTAIYAHLSRFALPGVEQIIPSSNTRQTSGGTSLPLYDGKPIRVKAGDIIGYIGTTGNSTGLHLHFELYENGKRVNPPDMFPELVK